MTDFVATRRTGLPTLRQALAPDLETDR